MTQSINNATFYPAPSLAELDARQAMKVSLSTLLEEVSAGRVSSLFVAYTDQDGSPGLASHGPNALVLYSATRMIRRVHKNLDEEEAG